MNVEPTPPPRVTRNPWCSCSIVVSFVNISIPSKVPAPWIELVFYTNAHLSIKHVYNLDLAVTFYSKEPSSKSIPCLSLTHASFDWSVHEYSFVGQCRSSRSIFFVDSMPCSLPSHSSKIVGPQWSERTDGRTNRPNVYDSLQIFFPLCVYRGEN